MSERKVLQKYYPPDFDPSKLTRQKAPKKQGPKVQTVRLMAPFSMRCMTCSCFVYKGRKFNARKEETDERYYSIKIIRFYIKCTGCSAEITFKTDPKNNDYTIERGAQRNFEAWREAKLAEETEEERLDRLQAEEDNRDAMADLESKQVDAKTEMAIADALDEIRTKNAIREKTGKDDITVPERDTALDEEKERQDQEDAEAARKAFEGVKGEQVRPIVADNESSQTQPPPVSFKRTVKKKKNLGAALGIKQKSSG